MLLPPHWPMGLQNCQSRHRLNPMKMAKIQLLAKLMLRRQTNADTRRHSDLQPELSPPNSIFSSTLPAQFFQNTAGKASRELLNLPLSLCVSYSMFYSWIWPLFRSHFCLRTIKTGTATKIISPIVPLPALSLMPAQAWILLHTRL